MKCLYPNSFVKLDSFFGQRMEITLVKVNKELAKKTFIFSRKPCLLYLLEGQLEKIVIIVCRKICLLQLQIQEQVMFIMNFLKLYFLEFYFKAFIRTFSTEIVLYLSEIFLFIYLICLFILFIYQMFTRNKFIKHLSSYISENVLYIMIYKYDIFEFKLYSSQKETK